MQARFLGRDDVGGGLALHRFAVPPEITASYTHPGQYVRATFPVGTGYFALVNPVGANEWELLVRGEAGDASAAMVALEDGAETEITTALGRGFPIDDVRGRPLVIALAGSAIGLARPLLAARRASGELATTWVYAGVRSPDALPLAADLARADTDGAFVRVSNSRAFARVIADAAEAVRSDRPRTTHRAGYVQGNLEADRTAGEFPANAAVFTAGPDPMVAAIVALGRAADFDVYTNV